MDEMELEEGEACSYNGERDGDGYNSPADPDIVLSYIDEKIQDVLGHFQKDFEGGLSAENLGAKFGGYGSFLPTYQRSPGSTISRSSSKVQQKPSRTFQSERASHLTACSNAKSTPPLEGLYKKDGSVPSLCAEDFSRHEPANLSNHKTMKLQVKIGSHNASSGKRASIYSGLGLDVSPSSSMEETHSGSDRMLHEHQDAPFESPTSILQMMTSFPVVGDLLLSPLPDNMLNLTKREKAIEERRFVVSGLGANGANYIRDIRKVPRGKKVKSLEKNDLSTSSGNSNSKGSRKNNGVIGRKKLEIDMTCEEMVSRTLQLPLVSNVDRFQDDMTRSSVETFGKSRKGIGNTIKGTKSKLPQNYPEIGKLVVEDREEVHASDCFVQAKEDSQHKVENSTGITATSWKQDLPPKNGKISSGGKERSKASQNQVPLATEVPEESSKGFSSKNKNMNSVRERDHNSKTEDGEFKADEKFRNGRERHLDFFGDAGYEEDQPGTVVQDSGTVRGSMSLPDNEWRERSKGETTGKLSSREAHLDAAQEVGPGSAISMSVAAPVAGLTPSAEDKWVYCHKCKKKRLFPPGNNLLNPPDKWICRMLDWLPRGMNSCRISQEETTNAVRAMCRTTSENAHNHVNGIPGLSSAFYGCPHYDEMPINAPQNFPGEVPKDGPAESSNLKRSMQISVNTRSLNNASRACLEGQDDVRQLSESSHGRVAREAIKEKVPKHSSGKGDVSKSKSKRGQDQGLSKSSKKARSTSNSYDHDDRTSDRENPIRRTGENSTSTVMAHLVNENQKDQIEASLNIPAYDTAGKSALMVDQDPAVAPDEGEFIAKRRKTKESRNPATSLSSLPGGVHCLEENRVLLGVNECREGKIRVENFKRKEPSTSNWRIDEEDGRSKNQQSSMELESTNVDFTKSGRGLGLKQPLIPAASSSSKASGSLKSKVNIREMKSSPAESVSSSPVRSSKPDNCTLARQTFSEKHECEGAVVFPTDSPRTCSNREVVYRTDVSGNDWKDATSAAAPNGSLESSILDPDKDNLSGNSDKAKVSPSPDINNRICSRSCGENFGRDSQHSSRLLGLDKFSDEEMKIEKNGNSDSLKTRESEKVSSSRAKDKYRASQPVGIENLKLSDSFKDMEEEYGPDNEGKPRVVRTNQESGSAKGGEGERNHIRRKDSSGKQGLNNKRKSQSNLGDARRSDVAASTPNCDNPEISIKSSSRKADQVETVSGREKSLPDVSTCQKEIPKDSSKLAPGAQVTNVAEDVPVSLSCGNDALKASKQIRKADNLNGNQQKSSRHVTSNGHRVRDVNAPSPARRDSGSHAAVNALKEAKDLKHLADRLKNGGSNSESIGLYFQAALKFLHGAALMESSYNESSKRGDMVQSIQIYGSTAKLCEFCAHEYEKSKDMASAALAYKCMEVAYLKVVYSSHNNAGKDRQELQTALKIHPPEKAEKHGQSTDASSPQVTGSQTITATKKPNLVRLLNFAQDVNSAMEASRKSRIAFSAATSSNPKFKEAIPSIKTALDYNFQDVDGLLRLVRVATEALSR